MYLFFCYTLYKMFAILCIVYVIKCNRQSCAGEYYKKAEESVYVTENERVALKSAAIPAVCQVKEFSGMKGVHAYDKFNQC